MTHSRLRNAGGNRYRFIEEVIDSPEGSILSIGCSFGWELKSFFDTAERICGIDPQEKSIRRARRSYPTGEFQVGSSTQLPYPANHFDVAILSEVIEHVGEEKKDATVAEAHRILKPQGQFIFTAPYRGFLAWADPMDFKRRFPEIYRAYMQMSGYNPNTPIGVGHRHLSLGEVHALFHDRFHIEKIRFCGLVTPLLEWIILVGERLRVMPRGLTQSLARLRAWEGGLSVPPLFGYSVRISARKI